jgi:hypothetical protein
MYHSVSMNSGEGSMQDLFATGPVSVPVLRARTSRVAEDLTYSAPLTTMVTAT